MSGFDAPLPAPALRVVFLGTPALAATVLGGLLDGPDPVGAAFTRPDAPRGRGLAVAAPPVAELARRHGVPVHQPTSWRDGSAVATLRELAPDLLVVAAYGRILPQAALDVPRFGSINVHTSLLPRWRGADPIHRAMLAGDAETGVTIMGLVLEMDAGPILWQRATAIGARETADQLEARLAELGRTALIAALQAWRRGELVAREQDPASVTFAPMIGRADGRLDFTRPARELERTLRALTPWPGASATIRSTPLRLWSAEVVAASAAPSAPGEVLSVESAGVRIATGDEILLLREVQAPGKRKMSAADWARGFRLATGEIFVPLAPT